MSCQWFALSRPEEARGFKTEHEQIRAQLMDMGVDLDLHCLGKDQVQAFVDSLRAHASREDALLYPWAARRLSADAATSVTDDACSRHGSVDQGGGQLVDRRQIARPWSFPCVTSWWAGSAAGSRAGAEASDSTSPTSAGRGCASGSISRASTPGTRSATIRCARRSSSISVASGARSSPARRFKCPKEAIRWSSARFDLHGVQADVALEITDDLPRQSDSGAARMSFPMKARLDRRGFGLRWNQDLDVGGLVVETRSR